MRRSEPTPELLDTIKKIRADRANWNRGSAPGFQRLWEEFLPEVDRLLVRRATEMVIEWERPTPVPGTAVAVPNGAAPVPTLSPEPETPVGDSLSLFGHEELTLDDVGIDDGKPYVVASALARVLGYASTFALTKILSPGEAASTVRSIRSANGVEQDREVAIVYRRGVLRILFRSDKPVAREITDRVLDILDTIERTGAYVAPTPTAPVLGDARAEAVADLQLIRAAQGLVDAHVLSVKAEIALSRGLRELPQVAASEMPVYIEDFMRTKVLDRKWVSDRSKRFGLLVSNAYERLHGKRPSKAPGYGTTNGVPDMINAYTPKDLPLIEEVWGSFYGGTTDPN